VPILAMAYRASVNDTTGFSPNMLMLGREVRLPMDLVLPDNQDEEVKPVDYLARLRNHLSNVYHEVRHNTEWSIEGQKRAYDANAVHKKFKVGDWVWYNVPTISDSKKVSRKLRRQRRGPYLVVKYRGDVKYVIALNKDCVKSVHVDQLFKYHGTKRPRWHKYYAEDILKAIQPHTKDVGCGTV